MTLLDEKLESDSPDSSDGNFESLYRPVEGIANRMKSRVLALLGIGFSTAEAFSLPVAPVLDAIDSRIDSVRNRIVDLQTADHESTHLFLSILNDSSIFRIWMSQYGDQTTIAFGLPNGFVATSYDESLFAHSALASKFRDLVDPTVLDASKLSDEWIVKHTFMLISGYSVNADSEGGEDDGVRKMMRGKFALPAFGNHDVAVVKKILASTKYKNVMNEVFNLLIRKIQKFLGDSSVRKVIDIFSSELLEKRNIHAEGKEIAPMMVDLLERKGVGKADFEEMRRKYDEMVKETVLEMREFLQ
ncbi:MAG: hypothetical protein AAB848_01095 [Patescibacteria group bacterium]